MHREGKIELTINKKVIRPFNGAFLALPHSHDSAFPLGLLLSHPMLTAPIQEISNTLKLFPQHKKSHTDFKNSYSSREHRLETYYFLHNNRQCFKTT